MDNNYRRTQTESINFQAMASDGEKFPVAGERKIVEKKYNIKKLNSRIWLSKKEGDFMSDIFLTQSKICKTTKQINMFRELLINTNREHKFTMSAVKFGELNSVTRDTAYRFILRALKHRLLYKIDTNIYLVNPFLFTPIGAISENVANAQSEWRNYIFAEDLKNPEKSGLLNGALKMVAEFKLKHSAAYLLGNTFFQSLLHQYIDGKKMSEKQIAGLNNIK